MPACCNVSTAAAPYGASFGFATSDHFHVFIFQVFDLADVRLAAGRNPHGQDAHRIDGVAARRQQPFVIELVGVFRVRRQENIERRRVLDLVVNTAVDPKLKTG
jgi:hypothetical protein